MPNLCPRHSRLYRSSWRVTPGILVDCTHFPGESKSTLFRHHRRPPQRHEKSQVDDVASSFVLSVIDPYNFQLLATQDCTLNCTLSQSRRWIVSSA